MLASTVIREARRAGLPADSISPTGSLRRYSPDIGDVSLLATASLPLQSEVLTGFGRLPSAVGVLSRTPSSVTIATARGTVTVHVTSPEQAGAAMAWHTGSRAHTDQLIVRAEHRNLVFRDAHLHRANGVGLTAFSESELYRHLDLPYIAPEMREGRDEIAAADAGALPTLVSDHHIRGDLHTHTTWSDGRDSLETMVYAAKQLGYEYVAITDHSERAWSSRKLALNDIPRQRADLEGVREKINGIQILHGIEVDIMTDGSLDFDDSTLEGFDIVLASLHDHGGQEGSRLTERYLQAIHHPLVNVITHPANRSPAYSTGYEVDFERLFAAAVETGTAMEIDGAPGHLDMDGRLARVAVAGGVTLTIDSDCHRAEALARQMRFGVGTARRGWVEPRHVLNTRSIDEVRSFIARKRGRR
jgi:DNA polymerase (family 10)